MSRSSQRAPLLAAPAVADLDGDGRVEVAATTREGYLFVWDTRGHWRHVQAPTWHQDAAHTGRLAPTILARVPDDRGLRGRPPAGAGVP